MFAYIPQRHVLVKSSGYCEYTLPELKQFLAISPASSTLNQSNIFYIDENPDADETMMLVAKKNSLINEQQTDFQDVYVVLVGDGKTYEHLVNIKCLNGSELEYSLVIGTHC